MKFNNCKSLNQTIVYLWKVKVCNVAIKLYTGMNYIRIDKAISEEIKWLIFKHIYFFLQCTKF